MAVNRERVADFKALIRDAVEKKKTISYGAVYGIRHIEKRDVWDTFEAAACELLDRRVAILDSLLADGSGLPKSGFFDVWRTTYLEDFWQIAGHVQANQLTTEQRRQIVEIERARVWAASDQLAD